MLIGQIMVKNGFISESDLEYALRVQKERGGLLGMICFELGYLTEQQLVQTLLESTFRPKESGRSSDSKI